VTSDLGGELTARIRTWLAAFKLEGSQGGRCGGDGLFDCVHGGAFLDSIACGNDRAVSGSARPVPDSRARGA